VAHHVIVCPLQGREQKERSMSTKENKAIGRRYLESINTGNLAISSTR
jgi:hypothetical protein